MRLHLKVCKETIGLSHSTPAPFNSANGKTNGWDGLLGSNIVIKQVSHFISNGKDISICVENNITKETSYVVKEDEEEDGEQEE